MNANQHDRVIRYQPDLRPESKSSGVDAYLGRECLDAWIFCDPLALALRYLTTDSDIRAALCACPDLIDQLRPSPGPYAQYVAEHDAAVALDEIEKMLRGAA